LPEPSSLNFRTICKDTSGMKFKMGDLGMTMSGKVLTITNLVVGQPVTGSFYRRVSDTTAPTITISGLSDVEQYTKVSNADGLAIMNFTGTPTGDTFTITCSYNGTPVAWFSQVTQASLV
jgi:hypothetical protein